MLQLVKGGGKKTDGEIVLCPQCGCASWVSVTHSVRRKRGKIDRGVKALACLVCLSKGNVTHITGG